MFIPLAPVSEIFGTLFEALFLEETLREDPFTGEDPFTASQGARAPGSRGSHRLPLEQEVVRHPR